jgi:hypothetical protein
MKILKTYKTTEREIERNQLKQQTDNTLLSLLNPSNSDSRLLPRKLNLADEDEK